MATPHQRTSSVSAAQREALIIKLRADHVPVRLIAEQLGLSQQRVSQIHQAACERIPAAALHTVRTEAAALADRAIRDLLVIAENPQISPRTRAECWGQVRGWSESLRRLMGADAPMRREITVISDDAINAAIKALNDEMMILDAHAKELGVQVD